METTIQETEAPLTKEQEQEVVNNALAIVTEADRNDILKVVKTNDVVLIETHKKKLKNFKSRFPAKKFEITEDMVFNKEAYDKALAAWREIKNYRTQVVVKDFQKLKAPYIAITKFYNETCNPLIEQFKDVETPVGDFVDKMEALQKAEKDAERIALEKRSNDRVKALIDAGAPFDGNYYTVGSEEFQVETISIGMDTINSVPDDIFEKLLKDISEKAAFIAGKQKEKDDAAAKEQLRKDNELKQLKEQNIRVRTRELRTLGLVPDVATDGVTVTTKQIEELSFEEWNTLFDGIESKMEEEKNKAAKRNLVDARENELLAIGLTKSLTGYNRTYKDLSVHVYFETLETLDAESWGSVLDKAVSDIAKQKDAKVAAQGDKAMYDDFLVRLKQVSVPAVTTAGYKNKVAEITKFITSLI